MDFSCEQLELIYEEFKASDLPSHRSIAIIAWNRIHYGKFKDVDSNNNDNEASRNVFFDPLYDEFLEVEE
mgnify:CR=1 FL=1